MSLRKLLRYVRGVLVHLLCPSPNRRPFNWLRLFIGRGGNPKRHILFTRPFCLRKRKPEEAIFVRSPFCLTRRGVLFHYCQADIVENEEFAKPAPGTVLVYVLFLNVTKKRKRRFVSLLVRSPFRFDSLLVHFPFRCVLQLHAQNVTGWFCSLLSY